MVRADKFTLPKSLDAIEEYFDECGLTGLEKHTIRLLYGVPSRAMTLREVGEIFELSRERIRQIEIFGLNKIRRIKKVAFRHSEAA